MDEYFTNMADQHFSQIEKTESKIIIAIVIEWEKFVNVHIKHLIENYHGQINSERANTSVTQRLTNFAFLFRHFFKRYSLNLNLEQLI